ncbi:MAG TPA: hypothetical protein VI731_11130 [Bacteroidia bacterium]|nr:hypothetical protein [Bacteroidia bacterium]
MDTKNENMVDAPQEVNPVEAIVAGSITVESKSPEPFKITGDWDVISKRLQEKFTELNAEDMKFETGHEEDLVKRVKAKLKKGHEETIHLIRKAFTEKC